MLKKSTTTEKVEVQAKVEIKRVCSSLNLDPDLILLHSVRPWQRVPKLLRRF
jgi:hypothetical protein